MKRILQRRKKHDQLILVFANHNEKLEKISPISVSILTNLDQRHLIQSTRRVGVLRNNSGLLFWVFSIERCLLVSWINTKNWWHSPFFLHDWTKATENLANKQINKQRARQLGDQTHNNSYLPDMGGVVDGAADGVVIRIGGSFLTGKFPPNV